LAAHDVSGGQCFQQFGELQTVCVGPTNHRDIRKVGVDLEDAATGMIRGGQRLSLSNRTDGKSGQSDHACGEYNRRKTNHSLHTGSTARPFGLLTFPGHLLLDNVMIDGKFFDERAEKKTQTLARWCARTGSPGAYYAARNRCSLPRRAHQLASAYGFSPAMISRANTRLIGRRGEIDGPSPEIER
jgi:hypothetical protein